MDYYKDNEYDLEEELLDIEELDSLPPEFCPVCGSEDVERDVYDFLVCNSCGYQEVEEEDMRECVRCGTPTPEAMLIHGLCPVCADDMGV